MSNGAVEFYRSLVDFVRWLETNGDPTLPYDEAKGFAKYMQASRRLGADKLNRYFGKFLEVDHLVEKRFLGQLPSANLDPAGWDAKFVPKNPKIASRLNQYRTRPFPYSHSTKTALLKKLIPHGAEGLFTPQEIWDAHAWAFRELRIEKELPALKPYFRNAKVRFRVPERNPLTRGGWKARASRTYRREKAPVAKKARPPSTSEKRTQRNLERARQRLAREAAATRKAGDAKAIADRGTTSRLGSEPAPPPRTMRRFERLGKIAGRTLSRIGGIAFIVFDATSRANRWVSGLDADLAARLEEIDKILTARMQSESERNRALFDADPFARYWYRVVLAASVEVTPAPRSPRFTYTGLELVDVTIVKHGGEQTIGKAVPLGNRRYRSEVTRYVPVFEELTEGEQLAADGYPLHVIDRSHGGPTGQRRLQIIHDYVVFRPAVCPACRCPRRCVETLPVRALRRWLRGPVHARRDRRLSLAQARRRSLPRQRR